MYKKLALIVLAVFLITACNNLDPYAQAWSNIDIADTRSKAIDIMGQPNSLSMLELPLVSFEQLVWKSPANQRVYIITIIFDRVAAKTVVQ